MTRGWRRQAVWLILVGAGFFALGHYDRLSESRTGLAWGLGALLVATVLWLVLGISHSTHRR